MSVAVLFQSQVALVSDEIFLNDKYRVTQKKYSCLIKRKMHNKRGIFKIKIVLNYQWTNLNFDILILIFGCHLAEIWMFKVR